MMDFSLGDDLSSLTSKDSCGECPGKEKEILEMKTEMKTIKNKIISTDQIIKKYTAKCQEHLIQTKKLEEVTSKVDKFRRDCEMLEAQLKTSMMEVEPLKKKNTKLEKLKIEHLQEIEKMQAQLIGNANSQSQVAEKLKHLESQLVEKDKLVADVTLKNKDLGSRIKKAEKLNKKIQEELDSLRVSYDKHQNAENRQTAYIEKQTIKITCYEDLLRQNGLITKARRLASQHMRTTTCNVQTEELSKADDGEDTNSDKEDDDGDDDDDDDDDDQDQVVKAIEEALCSSEPSKMKQQSVKKTKKTSSMKRSKTTIITESSPPDANITTHLSTETQNEEFVEQILSEMIVDRELVAGEDFPVRAWSPIPCCRWDSPNGRERSSKRTMSSHSPTIKPVTEMSEKTELVPTRLIESGILEIDGSLSDSDQEYMPLPFTQTSPLTLSCSSSSSEDEEAGLSHPVTRSQKKETSKTGNMAKMLMSKNSKKPVFKEPLPVEEQRVLRGRVLTIDQTGRPLNQAGNLIETSKKSLKKSKVGEEIPALRRSRRLSGSLSSSSEDEVTVDKLKLGEKLPTISSSGSDNINKQSKMGRSETSPPKVLGIKKRKVREDMLNEMQAFRSRSRRCSSANMESDPTSRVTRNTSQGEEQTSRVTGNTSQGEEPSSEVTLNASQREELTSRVTRNSSLTEERTTKMTLNNSEGEAKQMKSDAMSRVETASAKLMCDNVSSEIIQGKIDNSICGEEIQPARKGLDNILNTITDCDKTLSDIRNDSPREKDNVTPPDISKDCDTAESDIVENTAANNMLSKKTHEGKSKLTREGKEVAGVTTKCSIVCSDIKPSLGSKKTSDICRKLFDIGKKPENLKECHFKSSLKPTRKNDFDSSVFHPIGKQQISSLDVEKIEEDAKLEQCCSSTLFDESIKTSNESLDELSSVQSWPPIIDVDPTRSDPNTKQMTSSESPKSVCSNFSIPDFEQFIVGEAISPIPSSPIGIGTQEQNKIMTSPIALSNMESPKTRNLAESFEAGFKVNESADNHLLDAKNEANMGFNYEEQPDSLNGNTSMRYTHQSVETKRQSYAFLEGKSTIKRTCQSTETKCEEKPDAVEGNKPKRSTRQSTESKCGEQSNSLAGNKPKRSTRQSTESKCGEQSNPLEGNKPKRSTRQSTESKCGEQSNSLEGNKPIGRKRANIESKCDVQPQTLVGNKPKRLEYSSLEPDIEPNVADGGPVKKKRKNPSSTYLTSVENPEKSRPLPQINSASKKAIAIQLELLNKKGSQTSHLVENILNFCPVLPSDLIVEHLVQIFKKQDSHLFAAVYTHSSKSCQVQNWKPIMAENEVKAVELLVTLRQHSQVMGTDMIELLYQQACTLMTDENQKTFSICRVLAGVCRQVGDFQTIRMFLYFCLLKHVAGCSHIFLAVAGVWPRVLRRTRTHGIMEKVFECLICNSSMQPKNQKFKLSINKLLDWTGKDLDARSLALAIFKIMFSQQLLNEASEDEIFTAVKAMKLLIEHESWEWNKTVVLTDLVWPRLNAWMKEKLEFPYISLSSLVLVAGWSASKCVISEKHSVMELVKLFALIVQDAAPVQASAAVQEDVISVLMLLAPFNPQLVGGACLNWVKLHNKTVVKRSMLGRKFEQFVDFYKDQLNMFNLSPLLC